MKYVLLFIFLPFLSFSQNWDLFQVDSLGFSVKSPYKLVKKTNTAMTDFGNIDVISYGIQAPETDQNFLYQIMIVPYPENTFHPDSTELKQVVVQEFINASYFHEDATMIYQTTTKQSGQDFEQWVIHHKSEYSIKSKATLKDNKLYVIQVITPYAKSVNTDIDKFLDSFQFLN